MPVRAEVSPLTRPDSQQHRKAESGDPVPLGEITVVGSRVLRPGAEQGSVFCITPRCLKR